MCYLLIYDFCNLQFDVIQPECLQRTIKNNQLKVQNRSTLVFVNGFLTQDSFVNVDTSYFFLPTFGVTFVSHSDLYFYIDLT